MAFTPKVKRQIITDNLQVQSRGVTTTLEARLSHLSDLARVLCDSLDEVSTESIRALAEREALLPTTPLHKEALPIHQEGLSGGVSLLTCWDQVRFCEYLADRLIEKQGSATPAMFVPIGEEISRVAYMSSGFAEEAFDIFSLSLSQPKVLHCEDYEASCLALACGDADACILPYRDQEGNDIRMTRGLLEAYGLYVVALCTVYDGEDDGMEMEYALCSKKVKIPQGGYQLHLRLKEISPLQVEELICALKLFSLSLGQMTYINQKLSIWLAGEASLLPVFLWLTLFGCAWELGGLMDDLS